MEQITNDILIEKFNSLKLDEGYYQVFVDVVQKTFEEYEQEEPNDNETPIQGMHVEESIDYASDFMKHYVQQREAGHGEEWSLAFSSNKAFNCFESEDSILFQTYIKLRSRDEELAKKEADLYISLMNKDELYKERYRYLFYESEPDIAEVTQRYCDIYRRSIKSGNSELFARTYADLADNGYYCDDYCLKYAEKYDELVTKGFDETLAAGIADDYGDGYVNKGHREDPDIPEYWEQQIEGKIRGWQYVMSKKLEERFVKIYQEAYLDIHYCDHPELVPWNRIDDFILEVALAQYNGGEVDLSKLLDFKQKSHNRIATDSVKTTHFDPSLDGYNDFEKEIIKMMFPDEEDREQQISDYMDKL